MLVQLCIHGHMNYNLVDHKSICGDLGHPKEMLVMGKKGSFLCFQLSVPLPFCVEMSEMESYHFLYDLAILAKYIEDMGKAKLKHFLMFLQWYLKNLPRVKETCFTYPGPLLMPKKSHNYLYYL